MLNSFKYEKWVKVALAIIVSIYLLDCFTPLRLHVDTVRYYAIKDCIEFGCPPDSDAATDYFPYGYTALLLILSKLGILKSFTIVFLNTVYLFAGLYLLYKVFADKVNPYFFFLIVLLQWLFVKFVAHPLSEMQYIFFSLTSIYFFYRFIQFKQIKFLIFSLLMGWLAFMTRTIGVTLVAALCIGLMWEYKEQQLKFIKKQKLLVTGVIILLCFLLYTYSKPLGIDHYLGVLSKFYHTAPMITRFRWRFVEWGEIFLNLPANKIIDRLFGIAGEIFFILIGLFIFCWFMVTLWFKKNDIPIFIKVYIVLYTILMFFWPFNDPRFWVPIMPVMTIIVLQLSFGRNSIIKYGVKGLLTLYVFCGFFAAGYMLYSSFNKSFFAKNQAKGSYQREYEIHFLGSGTRDSSQANPYVLDLLKRYD